MDKKVLNKLASGVVNYSLKMEKNKKAFIIAWNESQPLVRELVKEIAKLDGEAYVVLSDDYLDAAILKEMPNAYTNHWKMYKEQIEKCDYFINIRSMDQEVLAEAGENAGAKRRDMLMAYDKAIDNIPWVLFSYPTKGLAKQFGLSQEKMEEYWLYATGFDYASMEKAAKPLVDLMAKTNNVKIKGNGTDLEFSMENVGSVPCTGDRNLPDGEVYSAPVKNSVNGVIKYSIASPNAGKMFEDITFKFKDGKIVEATCKGGEAENKALNAILDTDEGARYIGEFAIGINPFIKDPVGNILFDEKMMGSFHLTPGQAYKNAADNGNNSKIHWDIVHSQQARHGGGEIYFDDVLIRKDGIFVTEELKGLNPDQMGK